VNSKSSGIEVEQPGDNLSLRPNNRGHCYSMLGQTKYLVFINTGNALYSLPKQPMWTAIT